MRRAAAIACALMVVVGLVPAPGRAAEPLTLGRTAGTIECRSYQYETSSGAKRNAPMMPCDRKWAVDVVNAPEWTFDESRRFDGRAANGISYVQTIAETASLRITRDPEGKLTELELDADLLTTVRHVGQTSVVLDLDIPFAAATDVLRVQGTLGVVAGGGGNYLARSEIKVSVECSDGEGGTDSVEGHLLKQRSRDSGSSDQGAPDLDAALQTGDRSCVLRVEAKVNALNPIIIKSDHVANAEAHLDVKLSAAPCDLSGVVRDGDQGLDQHANPMPGIKVELYGQDDTATGVKDVTDAAGMYCLRDVPPDDYTLRAALADGAHDPPIFRTLHGGSPLPENTVVDVVEGDLGRDDLDMEFDSDEEHPARADAANIHWQSTRFVDWLLASGVATAQELGTFTMRTGATEGTSHRATSHEIFINVEDTPYGDRIDASAECPENCEWHEIAHHVANMLGIAPTPDCVGRVRSHGGWRNGTTCDSLAEGFASYLSTLGSLTVDAGRGAGYATPDYSVFGSAEDNGHRPWHLRSGANGEVTGDEDQTVTELLWDLTDDTPGETETVGVQYPLSSVPVTDGVSIDGVALVRLMSGAGVMTVAALYRALGGSDLVMADLKKKTVSLDFDHQYDVTPLDAVFLLHGFYPVHDVGSAWYLLGDPIGVTNRQAVDSTTGQPVSTATTGALTNRDHWDLLPGEAIEFTNDSAVEVTYDLDIAYPATSSHRTVTVGPGSSVVAPVVLPPYWRGFAAPGVLPACDPANDRVVTLTISGGGAEPRTITNCEYWKLMAETTSGVALVFPAVAPSAGPSGPAASSGPGGTPAADGSGWSGVLVIVAAAVAAAVVVLVLVGIRRRRRHGGTATGG